MRPSACGAHHAGQGCTDEPLAIAPPPRTDRRLADPPTPRASVSRGGFLIHIRAVLHSPERSKVPGKIQRQDRELTNIGTPSGDSPRQGCDSAAGPDRNPSFFPSRSRQELFRASVASGGDVPRSQEDIPDEDAHSAPPGLVADFGATVRMAPTRRRGRYRRSSGPAGRAAGAADPGLVPDLVTTTAQPGVPRSSRHHRVAPDRTGEGATHRLPGAGVGATGGCGGTLAATGTDIGWWILLGVALPKLEVATVNAARRTSRRVGRTKARIRHRPEPSSGALCRAPDDGAPCSHTW
jgi:hypothetical protein